MGMHVIIIVFTNHVKKQINAYFRWIVQLRMVQTRNNTPAPPPMRPRVASVQLKTQVGSNSGKESGELELFGTVLSLTQKAC